MNAPNFALVPPSPLASENHSPSSSSGTGSSNESRTTASASEPSSYPETSFTTVNQKRESSETAIFSIYSMYGEEQTQRASWFASGPVADGHHGSRDSDIPSVKLNLPAHHPDSFFGSNSFEPIELPYLDHSTQPPLVDHTAGAQDFQTGASTSDARSSLRVPRTGFRPTSTYSHPRTPPPPALEERRLPTSHNIFPGEFRTSSPGNISAYPFRSRSVSPHAARPSRGSQELHKVISARELPPLPPSVNSTPPVTPPPNHIRQPSPPFLLTPRASSGRSPVNLRSNASSPSSKISLVPSEGEDMDAFHVRHTYALLEMSGVKGDGYEEGVERTRARVGNNRQSLLNADAAIGDGNEKSRELDPKEIQLLGMVDRYGFISMPSHDRLVRLSSAPLTKRLSLVSAGPPSAPPNATPLQSLPTPVPLLKETRRIGKWTRMLRPLSRDPGGNVEAWRIRPSKESKLRERVYKGIPDRWRSAAWGLLMSRFSGTGLDQMAQLAAEYRDRLDKPSTYDIQIDLDVPRTISGHVMFKTRYGAGQRSLFHVLHSFSLRCPTCGYVQGMGPIAATLLCYFEPERVYASLVRLHDAYNLHSIFGPGFPGLLEAIYVQERIMEQMMPDVYKAFQKHMISTTSYATKWYITLFANSVPFQTQLRLWDAFLLEGHDLFVAVAIAIVWVYRDHITSSTANFETILSLLSSFFVPEDENLFLEWIGKALGDKRLRANMTKWRADWQKLVAEGKDGTALL